jgi:amino acid transporter
MKRDKKLVTWLIIILLVLLPTGTPEDVFLSSFIKLIGLQQYIILVALIIGYFYYKGIGPKKVLDVGTDLLKSLKKKLK